MGHEKVHTALVIRKYTGALAHVWKDIRGLGDNLGCHFLSIPHLLGHSFSLSRLGRLTIKPQDSSCLPPQCMDSRHALTPTFFLFFLNTVSEDGT